MGDHAVHGCELLFDAEMAAKVCAEVRFRMGGESPCAEDRPCPLLPRDLGAALVPAQRVAE